MTTTPKIYQRGDVVRVKGEFYRSTSTASYINPDATYGAYIDVSGTTTSYTYATSTQLVLESTGTFYFDITTTGQGDYHYRFWSTGGGAAADWSTFRVQGDPFA